MSFLISRLVRGVDLQRASFSRADVLFYAASSIDEAWIRSTVLQCRMRGLSCVLAVGGRLSSEAKNALAGRGVRIFQNASGDTLRRLKAQVAVTASSSVARSMFRRDVKAVAHMPHSIVSLHMIYPEDAFDGFDVLFAAGPHQVLEFKRLSERRGLGLRPALHVGYGKFDLMLREARGDTTIPGVEHVLIAPSWGPNGLLPTVGSSLISSLLERHIRVTLRPHPLHVLSNDPVLLGIRKKFGEKLGFCEEAPDLAPRSMMLADVLITDYSGTAFEFAWLRRRPTLFVDVPKKIVNENWEAVGLMPVEVGLRERIGIIVAPVVEEICNAAIVLCGQTDWSSRIESAIPEFLFDARQCGQSAADAIETLITSLTTEMVHS